MTYTPFDFFVFRTTLFPFNVDKKHIVSNEIFAEAIFLASQDLYAEFSKNDGFDLELLSNKAGLSLVKYANRAMSRCTPFGLFAGIGSGKISNFEDSISFNREECKKHTRLDMQLIYKIYQHVLSQPKIFEKLCFSPNTTIYKIGNQLKYLELLDSLNEFKYVISVADRNPALEKIITFTRSGVNYKQIVEYLVNLGYEKDNAELFVKELIENKILVPNLTIGTSGEEPLKKLVTFFKNNNVEDKTVDRILEVDNLLSQSSSQWGKDGISIYNSIIQKLDEFVDTKKVKNVFQVDLRIEAKNASLNSGIISQVKETLEVLNKLNTSKKNTALEKFKKKFVERYENQLIPLLEALDQDIGIGFSETSQKIGANKLLENISFIGNNSEIPSSYLSQTEEFLLKKYLKFISEENGSGVLELLETDFQHLKENWDGFPDTFSVMIEKIGADTINFLGSFGSSGANLLGRFCHVDDQLLNYCHSIINFEDSLLKEDTISAEVIHLPNPAVGNVILNPGLREYEISVLNPTQTKGPFSIPVSDLGLIIKGDRLVLWSYSLKKCIRPKITSAYIYSKNTLDLYNFLGHLQREYSWNEALYFSWGKVFSDREFLPRVVYKNIILSPARWNFWKSKSKNIPDLKDKDFNEKSKQFLKDRKIPNEVYITQGDNKLYIDFEKKIDTEVFFSTIKKFDGYIEEFLFKKEDALIKSEEGVHKNELLLFFKR